MSEAVSRGEVGCLPLPGKQRASSRRSTQQLLYLHLSKCGSAISRHGIHGSRNYSGRRVKERLGHGMRSSLQYIVYWGLRRFFKNAPVRSGNEKRQIDATFGTSDSSQSQEGTRPRHRPAALPTTKMACGVLPSKERRRSCSDLSWLGIGINDTTRI